MAASAAWEEEEEALTWLKKKEKKSLLQLLMHLLFLHPSVTIARRAFGGGQIVWFAKRRA